MRIGIVKLSSLGDVVHALPLLAALRGRFPGARLTWVAEVREAALLEGHPDLDAVVPVDTRRWRRLARRPAGLVTAWREAAAVRRALRARALDVAVDAQGLLKSGVFAAASRAPVRIGFGVGRCRERASALFTNCRVHPRPGARHVVDQYLTLLQPLGLGPVTAEFRLPAWPEAERRVERWFADGGLDRGHPVVIVNPGAGRADKRWAPAAFRGLAASLADDGQTRVLVAWGPGEGEVAGAIAAGLGDGVRVAPPTELSDLAALLRRASLVIAGDTGPLHLAAAVGARCLGLFGPTSAERNGPYGPRNRAMQSPDRTMAGLDPAAVLRVAREMLDAA